MIFHPFNDDERWRDDGGGGAYFPLMSFSGLGDCCDENLIYLTNGDDDGHGRCYAYGGNFQE
jgi:hypothetical protein